MTTQQISKVVTEVLSQMEDKKRDTIFKSVIKAVSIALLPVFIVSLTGSYIGGKLQDQQQNSDIRSNTKEITKNTNDIDELTNEHYTLEGDVHYIEGHLGITKIRGLNNGK